MARNDRLARAALGLLRAILKPHGAPKASGAARPGTSARSGGGSRGYESSPGQFGPGATRDLTREEVAQLSPSYSPHPDGDPDPGEVVWTWVPYVEHDGRGKDRPVLIISRLADGSTAGCYLSTKDHDGFIAVGNGGWDTKGRQSFLNPARLLRVTDEGMRREGTVLPEARFVAVAREIMNGL